MEHKKTAKGKRRSRSPQAYGTLSASLYGTAVGGISVLVLSLLFSLFCLFSKNPDALLSPLSLTASAISFLLCGFMCARRSRAVFPASLISSAALTAILWIISLFLGEALSSGTSLTVSLLIRLSFVGVAILGAMLGVNSGNKRKKRKR